MPLYYDLMYMHLYLYIYIHMGFISLSPKASTEPASNKKGHIPTGRSGTSHCFQCDLTLYCGEDNSTPLQYSCLENPMDRGAWWAAVHGIAKSQTRLSNFTFTFHFPALEKEMAAHSSVLAWRIPGTGEPGGLPSMGSHEVGYD